MNYMKIVPCDIANGEGVRVSLFVSGCNHHCPGCHNQQTWDANAGQPFTEETLDELIELLRPDYIQGLTLTGGDPMYPENREIISDIIYKVLVEFGDKKDIWVWTGYILKELRRRAQNDDDEGMLSPTYEILSNIDVLVDGPFIQEKRDISLPYMGSSNQRVIDMKKSTLRKTVLWWTPEEKGK